MDKKTRVFIVVAAACVLLSVLVPPWYWRNERIHGDPGWAPIFRPPASYGGVRVDFERLLLEWLAAAAVLYAAWWLTGVMRPFVGAVSRVGIETRRSVRASGSNIAHKTASRLENFVLRFAIPLLFLIAMASAAAVTLYFVKWPSSAPARAVTPAASLTPAHPVQLKTLDEIMAMPRPAKPAAK